MAQSLREHHARSLRVVLCALAVALSGCGGPGSTTTPDLAKTIKTTIKDLQSAEAICSGPDAHHAACDSAEVLVRSDVRSLSKAAGSWVPLISQLTAKDALTGATESGLLPAKSLADTRVLRLVLERVQRVINVPVPSLAVHASANATLPADYAKHLVVVLPGVSTEVTAASDSCSTPILDSCEVDVLIARAGVVRIREGYGRLPVSPADAPVDKVLNPTLASLAASLGGSAAALVAGRPIQADAPGAWASAVLVLDAAVRQLQT